MHGMKAAPSQTLALPVAHLVCLHLQPAASHCLLPGRHCEGLAASKGAGGCCEGGHGEGAGGGHSKGAGEGRQANCK